MSPMFSVYIRLFLCLPLFAEMFIYGTLGIFLDLYADRVGWARFFERRVERAAREMRLTMALKVTIANRVKKYVPAACREDENPFTIHMEALNPGDVSKLKDTMLRTNARGKVIGTTYFSTRVRAVLAQLADWENITDENGDAIHFDKKNKETLYGLLPQDIRDEIETVFGGGSYSEEAETNLAKEKEEAEAEDEDDEAEDASDDE